VQCYNAADVFVAPSLEDNLPNTVMESLSCGTPVVAFNIGGMPDMVEHKVNGYLAEPQNKISLANGIMWVIENNNKEILSLNARKKITKNFTPEIVANLYMNFYKSLI
jgi:glycosyltransferase involved in cell wall biosynthesis